MEEKSNDYILKERGLLNKIKINNKFNHYKSRLSSF